MTRINVGVPVTLLTDEHLLAEHREIKRICAVYAKRLTMPNGLKGLPTKMTLGTGHVLFFVDRGAFTLLRYTSLYDECKKRGFSVTDYRSLWQVYSSNDLRMYVPTYADTSLLIERIIERIDLSPKTTWHYYGRAISCESATKLLKDHLELL